MNLFIRISYRHKDVLATLDSRIREEFELPRHCARDVTHYEKRKSRIT